jgi:hypothetical protein
MRLAPVKIQVFERHAPGRNKKSEAQYNNDFAQVISFTLFGNFENESNISGGPVIGAET